MLRIGGRVGRNLVELLRLVAEHDRVGLLGQLPARPHGLAADRGRERLRLARVDVRDQRRLADPARESGGHVAGADESEPHPAQKPIRPGDESSGISSG